MKLTDVQGAVGAAVVVSILVQLIKPSIPEKWVPHVAVLLGIAVVLLATVALGQTSVESLGDAVLTGLLAGASAVGLYEIQRPVGVLPPRPGEASTPGAR